MVLLKKYWKRFNRGLIIALIIVLIIAVHTIVTNRRFKRDKKDVKETAEKFIDGLGDLKLFNCEGKLDDKARQEAVDEAMEYLDKYMTDETLKNTNYEMRGFRSKENYESIIKNLADANARGGAYIRSFDINVEHEEDTPFSYSVSRFGNRGITVEINYQYYIVWEGEDDELTIFDSEVYDEGIDYYGDEDESLYDEPIEGVQTEDGQVKDKSVSGRHASMHNDVTIYFIYTDGEWKISAVRGSYSIG